MSIYSLNVCLAFSSPYKIVNQLSETETSSGLDVTSEDEVDLYELKIQSCFDTFRGLNSTNSLSSRNLFLYLNFYEGVATDFISPPPKA